MPSSRAARTAQPGSRVVGAVGEPALGEQVGDVLERLVDPVVGDPELELADAGRVDHERTVGSWISSRRVVV